ncbi:MAG: hypothetical protein IH983_11460 [Planctomycetes bacterium]|nr:hypothetical protein [Planctomycetota bacterium]
MKLADGSVEVMHKEEDRSELEPAFSKDGSGPANGASPVNGSGTSNSSQSPGSSGAARGPGGSGLH